MTSGSPRIRWRRTRREAAARLEELSSGAAVDLPCLLRRTTSRGWGEWTEGRLRLPPSDSAAVADFVADDPSEVALVTRMGEAPVVLDPPLDVSVRPARYRAETFHGAESEILVVTSPRRVVEIALPTAQVELAGRRLSGGAGRDPGPREPA